MTKPKKRCRTPGCKKPTGKGRLICDCCRKREERQKDPIKYQYRRLQASAKRRSIPFALHPDWFRELCLRTDYHLKAGLMPGDLSIDRKESLKGYEPGNIRIITRTENTAKGNIERIPNVHIRRALLAKINGTTPEYTPPEVDESGVWW